MQSRKRTGRAKQFPAMGTAVGTETVLFSVGSIGEIELAGPGHW
jgi:hypothetical protein